MKLVFSSVFEADFAELIAYFQDKGGSEDQVCELIELLTSHPELGRLRKDLKPDGVRSFVVPDFRNYLLFYQIQRNGFAGVVQFLISHGRTHH